jgi:hypothetical protein
VPFGQAANQNAVASQYARAMGINARHADYLKQ